MKNVLLAVCVVLGFSASAFAGDCSKCKPVQATVTQTVEVTKTVVDVPVRAVVGFRSRLAVRRAARKAVKEAVVCTAECDK